MRSPPFWLKLSLPRTPPLLKAPPDICEPPLVIVGCSTMSKVLALILGAILAQAWADDAAALAEDVAEEEACLAGGGGFDGDCALSMLQRRGTRLAADGASLAEAGANASDASMFRCALLTCAGGSICCQSRDISAALCCAPGSICYFSAYNFEAGVRILNQLGLGSPRCFACNEKEGGCKNPHGGSKYYGPLPPDTKDIEGLPPVSEIPQ